MWAEISITCKSAVQRWIQATGLLLILKALSPKAQWDVNAHRVGYGPLRPAGSCHQLK